MDRRISPLAVLAVAAVFASLLHPSCGGGSPSGSTPPTTLTPSPPTTVPPPVGASCPYGPGQSDVDCERRSSHLLAEYEAAQDRLIEQQPQLFDLDDEYAPGSRAYRVRDHDAYLAALVASLQGAGLCAERDVDDPARELVFVKDSNDFSEEYDTLLSTGHVRRGVGAYRSTCTPASFPVDRPADAPPVGSGCYRPFPPPIYQMRCKIHLRGTPTTLDSTPLVLDPLYCEQWFPGRPDCPVRPEGDPERVPCENWRVGNAKDTGRPGPTWTKSDGGFCTGPESGCQNSDNQYQLWVYSSGTYRVCAQTGECCSVVVER